VRRLALGLLAACGGHPTPTTPATPPVTPPTAAVVAPPHDFTTTVVALPGGGPDGVFMDYLLFNPRTHSVWVPAGNTGSVDVLDTATGKLTRIDGFKTQEMERRGHKRVVGPSAASLGTHGVYIGNRGDASICLVDEQTLTRGACGTLDAMPDGVAYVATTDEVWVTTPRDQSIRILDGKTLAQKARLAFDGAPEGFAVDLTRGRFYTNLEDKDLSLAIDLKSHATVATWKPSCGEDGPHGLRLDEAHGWLFVACSAKVETLDAGHDGAVLGSVDTGDGVDDVDYDAGQRLLYVGAGQAAQLTVAHVDDHGALSQVARAATAEGARNGVVDARGRVYLSHGQGSELIVATPR
jgi:DNA-binding beta-propeller fold protein YncE